MAAADRVFLLVALLSLAFSMAHNHSGETETYYVSVDHLFVLRCLNGDAHSNVTWSRAGTDSLSLPTGVEVRDGLLMFLPVQMSHNGTYTCERRDKTGFRMTFGVSVSSGRCPDSSEPRSILKGVSDELPCKQKEIMKLNDTSEIRWMKDCKPMVRQRGSFSVNKEGLMRLRGPSLEDAGKYTCLIDISLDGRKYTSARSIQLTVKDDPTGGVIYEPFVVYPQQDVVMVEVGASMELKCLAYIGYSEDPDTMMYWTVDSDFPDDYKELNESWKYVHDRDHVQIESTLYISEVLHEFLNVNICCYVENSAVRKVAYVRLQKADHSALHTRVALCLVASLTVVALAAAFLLFKVDLVLAYRKLTKHLSKQHTPDGKLYDAYVSYLHPDDLSSAETESFALQILPEELEKQHGYSLYIRGRDDCPGEAVHDAIAATVRQCRRLIIILSPEPKFSTGGKKREELLNGYQNQLWSYEHKIGLYGALTQNDPRVILVEIDGAVDYTCLPESLRYIKRKQGSLKWKKPSLGTHKLAKLYSNRNFWKNLRYYMPSAPTGTLLTIL